jgi:cell wall assembly regulator SMI1
MLAAITRIDHWLAQHRPDYYAQLQPGVDASALDAFESRFSLPLPSAFRELYQWRNGQRLDCSDSLQGNWTFEPLEEVSERKDMLDGMIGYDFDDPKYWRRGWVPFLHNGGGSHLCVDLAAEDGGAPGQLIEFWKADDDRPVAYPSIETWLNGLADSMEQGTLKVL